MKKELIFNEEKHEYKLGKKKLTPVSDVLKVFFGDVDSKALARKSNNNPYGRYYKKGIKKILAGWKEIRDNGTLVHKEIEDYILMSKIPETKQAQLGVEWLEGFIKSTDYTELLLFPETRVYSEEYEVAGTIDLLMLDGNDMAATIMDWKTNEKLPDIQHQKMKHQVGELKNTKLQGYQMQLSLYAYLLELNGYDIEDIILIHLKEGGVEFYDFVYLKEEAKYMLENYRRIRENEQKTNKEGTRRTNKSKKAPSI